MTTRGLFVVCAFLAVVYLPWPFTAVLALVGSSYVPLLPLAIGIFADTIYYVPQAGGVPFSAVAGALATIIVLVVRHRLRAGMIEG